MKIALINPPYNRNIIRRWYCSIETDNYLFPPIELCYIGGVLKEKKDSEKILIDCIAEKIDKYNLITKLENFKPDLVIFMPGFQSIENDLEVMRNVKNSINTKVICFGHYPTLFGREILKRYNSIDIIIKDEPELTVSELYDALSENKNLESVKGIIFKNGSKFKETERRKPIQNLDELPFPDRSLLKNELYFSPFPDKKPFTTITGSRGCPFNCTYCIKSYGKNFRQRSIENVIEEMRECVLKYKIKTFRFMDDTFTINRERVMKFCDKLIKEELNVKWSCLSRPDTLDEKLLRKMKEAGCKQILVGVESGSQKILDYYKRQHDLEKTKNIFKLMRKVDLTSVAFFLIGAPIETKEDVKRSIEFAKEIEPDFIFVEKLTPIPGSEIFEKIKKEKKVKFSLFPYRVEYKSILPKKELKQQIFNFYFSFYFRWKYLNKTFFEFLKNPVFTLKMISTFINWKKRKYVGGYE